MTPPKTIRESEERINRLTVTLTAQWHVLPPSALDQIAEAMGHHEAIRAIEQIPAERRAWAIRDRLVSRTAEAQDAKGATLTALLAEIAVYAAWMKENA